MDAAKESVKKFMSKSGHHDTTVHEKVAPAVQNETISRTQHEQQTTALDREVHQDHYHTTQQPVSHSEVLAEQHHHRAAEVEHRSFEHDDPSKIQRSLEDERQQFRDTQTRVEGEKTRSENPTMQGEHVHHHVYETIQPVINKQTVEPHVVHTTVPIHEVHHNEAHHHAASTLPPVSMDEFKKQGGALQGGEEKRSFHQGELRSIGGHQVGDLNASSHGTTDHSGMDTRTKNATTDRIGNDSRTEPTGYAGSNTLGSDRDGYGSSTGASGLGSSAAPSGYPSGDRQGTDGHLPGAAQGSSNQSNKFGTMDESSSSAKKPSMMDKLNPKVDSNGDGKAGFMK